MDIANQLLHEHSRKNGMFVANYLKENPSKVEDLIQYLKSDKVVFQQRASQALSYLVEHCSFQLNSTHVALLIEILKVENLHNAVPRNILKILELTGSIEESRGGFVFDYCTKAIVNPKKPIAIRAFAVPVAFNLSQKYPDLQQELIAILESLSDYESPGVLHRKRKYLKKLRKQFLPIPP